MVDISNWLMTTLTSQALILARASIFRLVVNITDPIWNSGINHHSHQRRKRCIINRPAKHNVVIVIDTKNAVNTWYMYYYTFAVLILKFIKIWPKWVNVTQLMLWTEYQIPNFLVCNYLWSLPSYTHVFNQRMHYFQTLLQLLRKFEINIRIICTLHFFIYTQVFCKCCINTCSMMQLPLVHWEE